MSQHALVKDGAILEFRSDAPNVDQSKLAPGKPRLLPVVVERPEFNPARQTLTGPTYVFEAARVIERYTAVNRTTADRKAEMLRRLADKRWLVETSGITLGGITILTDRDTQSIVDRTVKAFADGDINGAIDFKSTAGFVQIDEATMRAIKAAGAQHIQACFTRESVLTVEIEAASTHAALDAIDITTGWSG